MVAAAGRRTRRGAGRRGDPDRAGTGPGRPIRLSRRPGQVRLRARRGPDGAGRRTGLPPRAGAAERRPLRSTHRRRARARRQRHPQQVRGGHRGHPWWLGRHRSGRPPTRHRLGQDGPALLHRRRVAPPSARPGRYRAGRAAGVGGQGGLAQVPGRRIAPTHGQLPHHRPAGYGSRHHPGPRRPRRRHPADHRCGPVRCRGGGRSGPPPTVPDPPPLPRHGRAPAGPGGTVRITRWPQRPAAVRRPAGRSRARRARRSVHPERRRSWWTRRSAPATPRPPRDPAARRHCRRSR